MLSLSSQIPSQVKRLSLDAFLRSSTKLARYARELLGLNASAPTVAAIARRVGCVRNTSALHLPAGHPERDRLLNETMRCWSDDERTAASCLHRARSGLVGL